MKSNGLRITMKMMIMFWKKQQDVKWTGERNRAVKRKCGDVVQKGTQKKWFASARYKKYNNMEKYWVKSRIEWGLRDKNNIPSPAPAGASFKCGQSWG